LGLVYATNRLAPDKTEMMGVFFDPNSAKPLAAIHASAESLPIPEDAGREEIELWEYDSRALARKRFEHLTFACLREMILRDQPQMVDVPEGWVPEMPPPPPEWPPRYYHGGDMPEPEASLPAAPDPYDSELLETGSTDARR